MKKVYVKPEIEYVSFKMSANIAGCAKDVTHTEEAQCDAPVEYIATNILLTNDCQYNVDSENSNMCYHVPSASGTFSS